MNCQNNEDVFVRVAPFFVDCLFSTSRFSASVSPGLVPVPACVRLTGHRFQIPSL